MQVSGVYHLDVNMVLKNPESWSGNKLDSNPRSYRILAWLMTYSAELMGILERLATSTLWSNWLYSVYLFTSVHRCIKCWRYQVCATVKTMERINTLIHANVSKRHTKHYSQCAWHEVMKVMVVIAMAKFLLYVHLCLRLSPASASSFRSQPRFETQTLPGDQRAGSRSWPPGWYQLAQVLRLTRSASAHPCSCRCQDTARGLWTEWVADFDLTVFQLYHGAWWGRKGWRDTGLRCNTLVKSTVMVLATLII